MINGKFYKPNRPVIVTDHEDCFAACNEACTKHCEPVEWCTDYGAQYTRSRGSFNCICPTEI